MFTYILNNQHSKSKHIFFKHSINKGINELNIGSDGGIIVLWSTRKPCPRLSKIWQPWFLKCLDAMISKV